MPNLHLMNFEDAEAAVAEITSAIGSLKMSPPELDSLHLKRVADAVDELAVALGLLPGPEHPTEETV